jgi:hypothetical protein
MLIGFVEGLGAAKTYTTRNHYEIDANRELIGLGAANLASGVFKGRIAGRRFESVRGLALIACSRPWHSRSASDRVDQAALDFLKEVFGPPH